MGVGEWVEGGGETWRREMKTQNQHNFLPPCVFTFTFPSLTPIFFSSPAFVPPLFPKISPFLSLLIPLFPILLFLSFIVFLLSVNKLSAVFVDFACLCVSLLCVVMVVMLKKMVGGSGRGVGRDEAI